MGTSSQLLLLRFGSVGVMVNCIERFISCSESSHYVFYLVTVTLSFPSHRMSLMIHQKKMISQMVEKVKKTTLVYQR